MRLTYLGGSSSNNDCASATPVAVGTKCYNTVHTTAGATASGEPNGACGDDAVKDVWFKTVVPSSGSLIISTSTYSIPFDGCMALYYGPCNDLTEIGCLDDVSGTPVVEMPTIYKTGMDPGAILYIRFWDKDEIGTNFNLCIYDPTITTGIDVDPAQNDAATLVQDVLITGCLEALNVTHTGHANSISYFDLGQVVGFNEGILLTSGNTTIAEGPNNLPNAGTFDGTGGDADLTTLSGNTTYNASVLEFDFIPSSDTVTFRYVFGSEEYPEYVCSQFNDVFGFFLSGPGISGPYTNGAINIAQVPNDVAGTINPPESYFNTPVAINSINIGESGAYGTEATCTGLYPNWHDYVHYYVRNGDGSTPADNPYTQYDGYTVPLVARAEVQACETYHIKLAVADASDEQLDSGVFLEANSFFSPDPPDMSFATATGDMAEVYEGCSTSITVTRANTQDVVNPEIVSLDLTGSTATPGADYPAIPDPVIIPPGDTSVVIDITPINDGSTEPDETIIINYYEGCPCTSTPIQEVITIKDFVGINGGIDNTDPIFCEGSSPLELTTSVTGQGAYTYVWNTGETTSSIFVSPTVNTIYSVDIIDSCGNFITDQVTVTFVPYPPTTFSHSATTCSYYNSVTFTPNAGAGNYVWSFPGGTPSSSTNQTPTVTFPPGGSYTVELTSVTTTEGCTSLAPTQETITIPSEVTGNISGTDCLCNGDNNGSADLTPSGGTPPYTYTWNPGSFATTEDVSGLSAGVYTVVISDSLGCVSPSPPSVTISEPTAIGTNPATIVNPLCNGDTNGSVTVNPTGGTPGYSYIWNTSPQQTANPASGLADGSYDVTITDANGCTYVTSYTVNEPSLISLDVDSTDAICNQATGSATVSPSGGVGNFTYQWSTGGTNSSVLNVPAGIYYVTVTDGNGCFCDTLVTVNDEGAPEAVISDTTMVSCFGFSDGSATVSASGGTLPYTYLWPATGCTDATANGLVGGMTYTVYVIDSLGCQSSTQITITQPTQIIDTLTGTDVPCNDGSSYGSATLIVSGGIPPYSYLWSNGETVQNPDNLASGAYTVTITDNNGCTKTDNVTINVPPALVASVATDSVSCFGGSDGAAVASATGGTPGETVLYEFDIGSGLQQNGNFTGLSAGSYTVTVYDDNGCTATEAFTISEPADIDITLLFVVNANCGSNDGSAAVSASGGTPPFTYVWYPSSIANDTASGLSGGTYTVSVTDNNGCLKVMDSIVVGDTPPGTAEINSVEHVDCNGNSTGSATVTMNGGTPPYEYVWSNFQTTATIENLPAGWYYVTVSDNNGCTSSTGTLISQPSILSANIPGENITSVDCYGDATGALEVDVSGGTPSYSYEWPSGGTGQTEQYLYAGPYTVTITDNNGCTTTASAEVTQPATALIIDVLQKDTVCFGESDGYAQVSAHGGTEGGGYSFLWPDNSTADDHYDLAPGLYTITVTDANNCTATRTIEIFEAPEITYNWDTVSTTCNGAENGKITCVANVVNPPYSYVWSNLEISTHLDSLAPGWYSVTITDGNSCTTTASFEVYNSTTPCLVIPNVITPNDDGYNDTWNIQYMRLYSDVTIKVFNRWGEVVFEYTGDGEIYEFDETKRWDGRSSANGKPLPLGAYIYVIIFNNTEIEPEQGIVTIIRKE